MPINRTTIKRGPAKITFGGVTLVPQGEAKLDLQFETFDVATSTLVDADKRVSNVTSRLSFTPDGTISLAILQALYACADLVQGQSIITESDLVITWKTDGETLTLPNWGISKPPQLMLSATKPAFGDMEIVSIGKNNTAWDDAAKRMTSSTATYVEAASPGDIITENPTISWGAVSPWDAIHTADGLKADFNLRTTNDTTDEEGIVDVIFGGLEVSASFTPKGITMAQVLTAMKIQGSGTARGASLNAGTLGDLVAQNSGIYFKLYNAALRNSPLQAGPVTNRVGELQLVNTKTAGDTPVFLIADTEPA